MENDLITQVTIKKLVPSILNPRKDPGDVSGLKQSIVAEGVIIPLIGRPYQGNGKVEIVAGSRRFAAISEAIKDGALPKDYEVPVIVREMTDQQVVEAMFIENLQREGLTEFDQAEAFQQYLYKEDDPSAIKQLAEKIGVTVQYVRRRAKVMELDPKMLAFWKEGKLGYGHMEQMLRLSTEDALEMAEEAVRGRWAVSWLKDRIERNNAILADAVFDKKALGCTKCPHSTQVQSSFFGQEGMKADKVRCTKPSCFNTNQHKWLTENWAETKTAKQYGTKKPIFNTDDVHFIYSPKEQCGVCDDFVSIMWNDGRVYTNMACNKESCYRTVYKTGANGARSESPEQRKERLSLELGKKHAEIFFKENMVAKLNATKDNDIRKTRLLLYALANNNEPEIINTLKAEGTMSKEADFDERRAAISAFKESVYSMDEKTVLDWIYRISTAVILNERKVSFAERKEIADQFDLKLERDYVMTEAFLKRMNRDRLIEMNVQHKIVDISADSLKQYKKGAIIAEFLKKDLSGIIPPEITAVSQLASAADYEGEGMESENDQEEDET